MWSVKTFRNNFCWHLCSFFHNKMRKALVITTHMGLKLKTVFLTNAILPEAILSLPLSKHFAQHAPLPSQHFSTLALSHHLNNAYRSITIAVSPCWNIVPPVIRQILIHPTKSPKLRLLPSLHRSSLKTGNTVLWLTLHRFLLFPSPPSPFPP